MNIPILRRKATHSKYFGAPSDFELTSEQLDLWEHAVLLYRSYEWHAAADLFATLANATTDVSMSVKCCINAALIQARLGDISNATMTIDVALDFDADCALAYFILGVLENCRGNPIAAEASFEVASKHIDSGQVGYNDLCPPFELCAEVIAINKHMTKARHDQHSPIELGAATRDRSVQIPAECLFEAPERDIINARVKSRRLSKENASLVKRALARRDFQSYSIPQSPRYSFHSAAQIELDLSPRSRITSQELVQSPQPVDDSAEQRHSITNILQCYQESENRGEVPVKSPVPQGVPKFFRPSTERNDNRPSFVASTIEKDPVDGWLADLLRDEEQDDIDAEEVVDHSDIFAQVARSNNMRFTGQDSVLPAALRKTRHPSPHRLSRYIDCANRFRMDNQDWKLPQREAFPPRRYSDPINIQVRDNPCREDHDTDNRRPTSALSTDVCRSNTLKQLVGQNHEMPKSATIKRLKRYCLFKALPPLPPPTLHDSETDLDNTEKHANNISPSVKHAESENHVASLNTPSTLPTSAFFSYDTYNAGR